VLRLGAFDRPSVGGLPLVWHSYLGPICLELGRVFEEKLQGLKDPKEGKPSFTCSSVHVTAVMIARVTEPNLEIH
jgi:hypothetical protein